MNFEKVDHLKENKNVKKYKFYKYYNCFDNLR